MKKCFRVYQTIQLLHYVEADTEAQAREIVRDENPLEPPAEWDTEINKAEIIGVNEYDPEG